MALRKLDNLRSGYTTGACAAAAAGAAMTALVRQFAVKKYTLILPGGEKADFKIEKCLFDKIQAACSVIKDAGDDPDITNGAEIIATVSWAKTSGINLDGGSGVGRVTKPGLEVPVGGPAINPVPRRMITEAVTAAAGKELNKKGIKVVISVTDGEALAKKTLNPRLGIVGGISILGTTGIVVPYSLDAYTACISQALDVAKASHCTRVVLTTGRRTEKFAQRELKLAEECFIQMGDYVGFTLEECAQKKITSVVIWGMPGKISKIAAGFLATNVKDSQVDFKFLARVAAESGVPEAILKAMPDSLTATHFLQSLPDTYRPKVAESLCSLAALESRRSVNGAVAVKCIMSDFDGVILGHGSAE